MHVGFGGGEESGADAHRVRSGGEQFGGPRGCSDPAGGDDGNLEPRTCRAHEVDQPAGPADVAAGLGALQDDQVAAGIDGSQRLVEGPDLPRQQRPGVVGSLGQVRVGVAVEALDERGRARGGLERGDVEERHQEPDADHAATARGSGDRGGQLAVQLVGRQRRAREHPQSACPGDRTCEGRCAHRPHRRELDRDAASDEPGEPSR